MISKIKKLANQKLFLYGIFWSWNFIFLLLLLFSQVSTNFIFIIIKNALVGHTPFNFAFYTLAIVIIPLTCIVLGITKLRNQPKKLLHLFYGVEIPLSLIFILRVFVFRELTPGTTHLLTILTLGMGAYFVYLFWPINKHTPTWLVQLTQIGQSLLLFIGLYIAIVFLFYTLPLISVFITNIFDIDISLQDFIRMGFWGLLFTLFFLYCSTLFILLPLALPKLYIATFKKHFKEATNRGKTIMVMVFILNIGLFYALNIHQPQTDAFNLLEKDFSKTENRLLFEQNKTKIKEGLINAYLNNYRYLSDTKSNNHVYKMYRQELYCSKEFSRYLQDVNNVILSPFLYQGSSYDDKKAADLYKKYFDGSIQKDETTTILSALASTWDSDDIEAGILNVNQEKVHIDSQTITVTEHGDIAEIEMQEIYSNATFSRQEIFYYFSLPPNAVITGLWLSDEADKPKKYAYQVSPRGAAQEVYKAEVQRRVDPSLLEQIGPNQYRLRAFPILPKTKSWKKRHFDVVDGDKFYLWFSYKTLISDKGTWQLPTLNEKRNVYWSKKTILQINDKQITKDNNWLPSDIAATNHVKPSAHYAKLTDSTTVKFYPKTINYDLQTLRKKHVDFLIDGSFSMYAAKDKLIHVLSDLDKKGINTQNCRFFIATDTLQLYTYTELIALLSQKNQVFFGSNTYTDFIRWYQPFLKDGTDGVCIISDAGNYENETNEKLEITLDKPLFIRHLNEQPPIYADAFLTCLQYSKGGVIHDWNEINQYVNTPTKDVLLMENGICYELTSDSIPATDSEYMPLAAKALINAFKFQQENQLNQLDEIHKIAVNNSIVSPYSSMIVLVNERQKEALKKAEEKEDRFDREVESGEETLSKRNNPLQVSGTPEPHEWILMGLVFSLLIFHQVKKRKQASHFN